MRQSATILIKEATYKVMSALDGGPLSITQLREQAPSASYRIPHILHTLDSRKWVVRVGKKHSVGVRYRLTSLGRQFLRAADLEREVHT